MNVRETQLLFVLLGWLFLLPLMISGCQTIPERESSSGVEPDSVVELDENTDPRFFSRSRGGVIGWIGIDGKQVFLNKQQLARGTDVPNGASIRTGPNSGARLELKTYNHCRYSIEDFRTGKIYGNTDACNHNIVLRNAAGRSTQVQTRYLLEANNDGAVVTVIAGEMRLVLLTNPGERITLTAFQEGRITPGGLVGPLPVDARTIRERMSWRSKFKFDKPSRVRPSADAGTAAAAALIWDLIWHHDAGHKESRPTPNDSGHSQTSPTTGGASPTPTTPGGGAHQKPQSDFVSVPNLRGKSVKLSKTILYKSGLKVRVKPGGAGSDYWVISQMPAAGKKVQKGSVVTISVSAPIK